MSIAVCAESLAKRYLIRHDTSGRSRYVALRDVLAEGISSAFRHRSPRTTRREEFWALRDVSFEVAQGDAVGVIGRNGAGKSTLLKLLSRITAPTRGRIEIVGRVASLLEVGTGFHPELTGRENVFLNGVILGMRRSEVRQRFDEIVAFAGVEKFLDTPVKHYSSGMYMRLAFSVAAHLQPEILIVDEVLAVGDMEFQKKCLGKMEDVSRGGRTVLFVSHNMDAILRLCSRAILLERGEIAAAGSAREVVATYTQLHAQQPRSVDLQSATRGSFVGRVAAFKAAEWPASSVHSPWTVPFGAPIEFSILVECAKEVRDLELGIALYSPSGTEIATSTSLTSLPSLIVGPGLARFHVCFPSLRLVPNEYVFGLGLRSGMGMEDYLPKAFALDVVPSAESSVMRTDTYAGYVVPEVSYALG
jgi:lipopolysaccharide transport system ATP-binding protein